jgi:hypothetical protein
MTSICEYLDELIDPSVTRLILYPGDTQVEIDVNTWHLYAGDDDTLADVEKIEAKVRELAATWTTRFVGKSCRTNYALFYCWYDEQAGQLRISLSSVQNPQQHFGAVVARVDSPRPIIQRMLNDRAPGIVAAEELATCCQEASVCTLDDTEEPRYILPVWAVSHTW